MISTSLISFPNPPKGKKVWPWTFNTKKFNNIDKKNSSYPKITIVTPSYNQGEFIEETIRSVLFQEYPNLEYIIIDGCSSDNSLEIIKKYENWLTYWISEKDRGQSDAINKGFKRASGDILGWLNSDDYYTPGSLLKVGKFFKDNQECNFLTGDGEFSYSNKKNIKIKANSYNFTDLLYYPQPSVFFSKDAFFEVGGLNESLNYSMDLELWIKLSSLYQLYYLPITFSILRQHEDAKTLKNNESAMVEVERTIIKNSSSLGFANKMKLYLELRYFTAKSSCTSGLKYYFSKDILNAKKALYRAFNKFPPIILNKIGLKLLLRIILPEKLKKLIFSNP